MVTDSITSLLAAAIEARAGFFDPGHESAFRLFNGFYEGCPDLAVDLYARTIVLHNYADPPEAANATVQDARRYLAARLPWVQAMVLKPRKGETPEARRGTISGETIDRRVREHGVWYALELLLNRDASLYLDTRNLRAWAKNHLEGKDVLNTFAYTGSLGVAAKAGGAQRVVHIDRQRAFLKVAKTSYSLNGFPVVKADFHAGDFWKRISHLKRAGERFDCVFVDPPFFSVTSKSILDMATQSQRVINKVRPLINHNGYLVAINNALFLSGAEYMQTLEALCESRYLSIEELIPVPPDFTGYEHTKVRHPPVDPAPFNHATKIAVMRVKRKDADLVTG